MTLMRSAHTATKGGVIALTRQLAAEGAWRDIRVNCISSGMVMTPATPDDIFGNPDHPMFGIRDHIPLGRIGTPDDIAPAALFLACADSAYMTGASLVIDGGWSTVLPGAPARPGT
jgi:NAD(P)-dependent dehydrogenase (short-subunit alcohol dehydrogenase family)